MLHKFWKWYEERYRIIAPLTALLFLLQIVHLYWLTTDVVFFRLLGHPFWNPGDFWTTVIALVDYTEIPAIVTSSVLYVHQYKTVAGAKWQSIFFLFLINSQWLHILWITDEVILAQFSGAALVAMPIWLSWTAIAIDYLELPVIYDTTKKAIASLRKPS